jgi:cell division protein ZapE
MPQHRFSPPADGSMSPKDWYLSVSAQPDFVHDPAQEQAVLELDTLWHELLDFKAKRNHFLGRSLLSPQVPKGLYFWGGVGRGKTFLMDVFYDCVPYKRKRRIHFHNFMAEIHHELKHLAAEKDPLLALADSIEKSTRLLCFDEFHITDITDAMLLGRLLQALFERGVVLMITSNHAPDELYLHGLQRQKFLPTIALLKRELRILNVDGGNDYRLREMSQQPMFIVPADATAEAKMNTMFNHLAVRSYQQEKQIDICGRFIEVQRVAYGVVWFSFNALCASHRDQSDYLEIAHQFHTVFISDIPLLNDESAAAAQRFIWLIDVLYDNRVKLIASAAAAPHLLYADRAQAIEFSRTASRLVEMQSTSYLALPHQSQVVRLNLPG